MKIERFSFNNVVLRDEGELLCLTDMWRAAGAEDSKRPYEWLRHEGTQAFLEYLRENLNTGQDRNSLLRTERGVDGGTWAHWQLALAYAKYLSPAFHAWCNEVVRKVMQGGSAGGASPELSALVQLVRDLSERQTRLENNQAALWRSFGALSEQLPVGGAIPAGRHNALVSEIRTLAAVETRVGKWRTRRAALADIRREIGAVANWGGKGRPWNEMPAALEPAVRATLRARMSDTLKLHPPAQLSIVGTEKKRSG